MRGRKCVERIGTPIVVFVAALSISVQAFAPAPSRFPASPTLGSRHDLPLEALREKKGDIKDSPVEDCTIPGDFDAPGRRGELVSLERKEIRLDGFEPYTLVSLLTASAFFEVISDVHVDWDVIFATSHPRDLLGDEWLNAGILLAGGGATITGVYATAIFSLTILYGKTALGLCRDDEHDKFFESHPAPEKSGLPVLFPGNPPLLHLLRIGSLRAHAIGHASPHYPCVRGHRLVRQGGVRYCCRRRESPLRAERGPRGGGGRTSEKGKTGVVIKVT